MLGRSPTAGATGKAAMTVEPPSSSGLGHRPFKAAARVRIPLGARPDPETARALAAMCWRFRPGQRRIARQETRLVAGPAGSRWLAGSFIPNGPGRLALAPGFSHTAQLRPPAP